MVRLPLNSVPCSLGWISRRAISTSRCSTASTPWASTSSRMGSTSRNTSSRLGRQMVSLCISRSGTPSRPQRALTGPLSTTRRVMSATAWRVMRPSVSWTSRDCKAGMPRTCIPVATPSVCTVCRKAAREVKAKTPLASWQISCRRISPPMRTQPSAVSSPSSATSPVALRIVSAGRSGSWGTSPSTRAWATPQYTTRAPLRSFQINSMFLRSSPSLSITSICQGGVILSLFAGFFFPSVVFSPHERHLDHIFQNPPLPAPKGDMFITLEELSTLST